MKRTILLVLIGALLLVPFSLRALYEKTKTVEIEKGVFLKITTEAFLPEKHKITYYTLEEDQKCPKTIDGGPIFGTTPCGMPDEKVTSITMTIDGRNYTLDASFMYDPLLQSGRDSELSRWDKNIFRFRTLFADGAATYYAEWFLIDGKSYRTVLTESEYMCLGFLDEIAQKKKWKEQKEKKEKVVPLTPPAEK